MAYDPHVPHRLRNTQEWFASVITRPMDDDSRINPISPSGQPMKEEACLYIAPSPTLKPDQRIQIYNQQYWWRLLSTLQESYPLVTRLFGYYEFNVKIAIPFLQKYPPNTWSLSYLGDRLPKWVEESYNEEDKSLVLYSAQVDWSFNDAFLTGEGRSIDTSKLPVPGDISSIMDEQLTLQPHISLFDLPYDLFAFRNAFVKEDPDYWLENAFPKLKMAAKGQRCCFILYRNAEKNVVVEAMSLSELRLLSRFLKKTASVNELCDWLFDQPDNSPIKKEASQNLHLWFQKWIARHWLYT